MRQCQIVGLACATPDSPQQGLFCGDVIVVCVHAVAAVGNKHTSIDCRSAKITPCYRDTFPPRQTKLLCRDMFALLQLKANWRRTATWFDSFKAAGEG